MAFPCFQLNGRVNLAIAIYNGKSGFINTKGEWYINPSYDEVSGFNNGLAASRAGNKWGYINTKGNYAISPRYDKAEPFENPGFAKVESNQKAYFINRNGEIISDSDTGVVIFHENLALLKVGGKYGYLNRKNEWQIEPRFDMAWPFKNGYAKVKSNGKWIFINNEGNEVDPSEFSRSINSFEASWQNKKKERGKWGFVDNQDRWVVYPLFDDVGLFSEGLAPVKISDKWGYIDTLGNIKTPVKYEEAYMFKNGLASVKINGKYGCIDNTGNIVIKPKFENPLLFFAVEECDEDILQSASRDIFNVKDLIISETASAENKLYIPGDKRLALIIGNGNYSMGNILQNPEKDAKAISSTLEKLGFVVKTYINTDQLTMKKAIDDFGSLLKDFDVGLFFYAGHGIQVKGYNYLIPVDANITNENEVEYNCVEAGRVLSVMESSKCKTNIVVLDACRNNPFERSWTRSAGGQGLAFMNAPTGSLIAYATAPGRTASDGSGENGLYTSSLLKYITTPGITILEVFQHVRSDVRLKSSNNQIPWESTSLEGNFYFIK